MVVIPKIFVPGIESLENLASLIGNWRQVYTTPNHIYIGPDLYVYQDEGL